MIREGNKVCETQNQRVDWSQFKAVFFDLDDTLYDQLAPFRKALEKTKIRDLQNKKKFSLDIEAVFKRVREHSDLLWSEHVKGEISLLDLRRERLKRAFVDFGLAIEVAEADELQQNYIFEQNHIKPFSEAEELLKFLQSNSIPIGVITNGPIEHQKKKLFVLGIEHYIRPDWIFVSDEVGYAKPDPRIFEYVREKLDLIPAECCYIGDSWSNDIDCPIKVGWSTIWYNYRQKKPLTPVQPLKTITNFRQLI